MDLSYIESSGIQRAPGPCDTSNRPAESGCQFALKLYWEHEEIFCVSTASTFYASFSWCFRVLFNDAVICWVHIASVIYEWARSIGGITLTGENWSTRRKTCPYDSVHHKSHIDWRNCSERFSSYCAVNTLHRSYKKQSLSVLYREIMTVCSEIHKNS
jgi:hypothetical protein